jgi:hypothetical protein
MKASDGVGERAEMDGMMVKLKLSCVNCSEVSISQVRDDVSDLLDAEGSKWTKHECFR